MEPPAHKPNLSTILSNSERILISNYTHFITLSFLFFPLSIYLITTPIFHLSDHQNFIKHHIFYVLVVYLFSLCAIATITYTTYHSISGKPVNFLTTFKSLTSSFVPIVITAIIAYALLFLTVLGFLLFVYTNLMLLHNLGLVTDYLTDLNSIYFTWLFYVTSAILIIIVTYFHVSWSLAFVVVVVESKSGLAALTRSWDLVKGMRLVSLSLCLYFGFFLGISVWVMSDCIHVFSDQGYVLFAMMVGSGLLMSELRQNAIAMTVLYNECMAFPGEVANDGFDVKILH